MKRCPAGSHREGRSCVPVSSEHLSEKIYPDVRDFAYYYSHGEYKEAKKARMRIERVAHKGAMPSYPSDSELACPRLLARRAACASHMIRTGQSKGYQPNAVCRGRVKRVSKC